MRPLRTRAADALSSPEQVMSWKRRAESSTLTWEEVALSDVVREIDRIEKKVRTLDAIRSELTEVIDKQRPRKA